MVVQEVNGAREAEGLPPLVRDRRLDTLAAQVATLHHHYKRRVVLEGGGAQARGPTTGPVLDADLTGIGVHVCYEGPTAFVTLVMGAADQAPALPAAEQAPAPAPALPAPQPLGMPLACVHRSAETTTDGQDATFAAPPLGGL